MAKRFIDTEIWKKSWFRQLPPKMKSVWVYLTTNCDHAGIYEVDLELMSFMVGQKVTSKEINDHLGNQISVINSGSKWYLFVAEEEGRIFVYHNLEASLDSNFTLYDTIFTNVYKPTISMAEINGDSIADLIVG